VPPAPPTSSHPPKPYMHSLGFSIPKPYTPPQRSFLYRLSHSANAVRPLSLRNYGRVYGLWIGGAKKPVPYGLLSAWGLVSPLAMAWVVVVGFCKNGFYLAYRLGVTAVSRFCPKFYVGIEISVFC
jgi:hypothetical protein